MKSYMTAFESLYQALDMMRAGSVIGMTEREEFTFQKDFGILQRAQPFMFEGDLCEALHGACHSISADVHLDWDIEAKDVWWYFEQPLPLKTTTEDEDNGIAALAIGYLTDNVGTCGIWVSTWTRGIRGKTFPRGTPLGYMLDKSGDNTLVPTQVFSWRQDESLAMAIGRWVAEYEHFYMKDQDMRAKLERYSLLVEGKQFINTSTFICKFITAALAFIRQRIVLSGTETVERHRRKDAARRFNVAIPAVKVVSLPRRERASTPGQPGEMGREWSHRWMVDGHWRNARVGVGREQRRLTYVHPYVKGPDDKPLIVKEKVFVVRRGDA